MREAKSLAVQASDAHWILPDALIGTVKVYLEQHEAGMSPPFPNPTALAALDSRELVGQAKKAPVERDVRRWINSVERVNDLKVTVRNTASNRKKARIDRIFVVVTYHGP